MGTLSSEACGLSSSPPTRGYSQQTQSPPPARCTDLPGPVGSPRGWRGWMRSYCLTGLGSRSVTGTGREKGPPRGWSGVSLLGHRPSHPPHAESHRGQRLPKGVPRAAGRGSTGACGWREVRPSLWDAAAPAPGLGLLAPADGELPSARSCLHGCRSLALGSPGLSRASPDTSPRASTVLWGQAGCGARGEQPPRCASVSPNEQWDLLIEEPL